MLEIGKFHTLRVIKDVPFGVYLDGQELGEILLPLRDVPAACRPGDQLEVFLLLDSEDRLIATTQRPYATVGEAAWLKVVNVTSFGAFLDWGLAKDLFVPLREQRQRMRVGRSYLVMVYFDEASERLAASSKLDKFLTTQSTDLHAGQRVDLLIADQTELGYKAIINHRAWGMLYHQEVFRVLRRGQQVTGFVKQVRDDGKIDLCLQQPGYGKVATAAERIVATVRSHGGFLEVTDKSSPAQISRLFGMSKKTYKQAVGALYKARRITLEPQGIRLAQTRDSRKENR
jgi:uncharacterized protein